MLQHNAKTCDFMLRIFESLKCQIIAMTLLVAMLRRMDWVTRHAYWAKFKTNTQLKDAVKQVCDTMGPDELLDCRGGGFAVPKMVSFLRMPIPMPDKVRPVKRQLTLHDFWKVRPKQKQRKSKVADRRQRTLFHYWRAQ